MVLGLVYLIHKFGTGNRDTDYLIIGVQDGAAARPGDYRTIDQEPSNCRHDPKC